MTAPGKMELELDVFKFQRWLETLNLWAVFYMDRLGRFHYVELIPSNRSRTGVHR